MNKSQVDNFLKCFLQIDEPVSLLTLREAHDEHDDHDHDHDDHDHEHGDSSVLIAKVTAMLVLFCASGICGAIPFLLNRCYRWTENENESSPRSAIVVKCLLYFGGGVLLATTFLHLLPEVQEVVEQLQDCGLIGDLSFPLAELLMCCGFFLMYFIEEAMHAYLHRKQTQKDGAAAAFERGHSIRNSHLLKTPTAIESEGAAGGTAPVALSAQDLLQNDILEKYQEATAPTTCQGHGHGHSHLHLPPQIEESDDMLASSLRGLFIVSALSLHELFEGMAIGLEGSASSVWFMFGAVSAHKLVLAFCVGVELIVAHTRLALSIIYVLTFAVVSPLGIGIGILIKHGQSESGPTLVSAILQGFACGTLIYVVFFEILSKNRSGLRAYLALFVGFLVMFGLQLLGASGGGHGHSHNHSCSTATPQVTESKAKTEDLEHHWHSPAHHRNGDDAAHYEQQLQILRQLTQKLLESHPKQN